MSFGPIEGHHGTWTQWHVDTMVRGHNGMWTQWHVDTMVRGHNGREQEQPVLTQYQIQQRTNDSRRLQYSNLHHHSVQTQKQQNAKDQHHQIFCATDMADLTRIARKVPSAFTIHKLLELSCEKL